MSAFRDMLDAIDRFTTTLWRECEHADAALAGLNGRLDRLARLGLVGRTAVLGPVVLTRPYAAGGPSDRGQAVQAVLALPGGFGTVVWDTDDLAAVEDSDRLEAEAVGAVVPYEECEPGVRALLAPHAGPLLQKLSRLFGGLS